MRPAVCACLVVVVGCSRPQDSLKAEARVELLEKQVEQQRLTSALAIDAYAPRAPGRLDDLSIPAVSILGQLPGAADVEVLVSAAKPSGRIVHIRDLHQVHPALFHQAAGKATYEEHFLEVEVVQLEHEAILRCLTKHHGLRRVLLEGLTAKEVPAYREAVAGLRQVEEGLHALRQEHAEVRGKDPAIDRDVEAMLRGHRRRLRYGAPGRLDLEVLPLEEERALEGAAPVIKDGEVRFDPEMVEARHDAQVRAALGIRGIEIL